MPHMYQRRISLFDGSSGESSTYTAGPHFTGNYGTLSVSYHTDSGDASRLTLQGSNDDGFDSAIVNWSNLTGITVAGMYTVSPGARWMRAQRGSQESLSIAALQART